MTHRLLKAQSIVDEALKVKAAAEQHEQKPAVEFKAKERQKLEAEDEDKLKAAETAESVKADGMAQGATGGTHC